MTIQPQFYSEKDLDAMGLPSIMTRWRLKKLKQFPQSFNLSPRRVAYDAAEINDWIEERKRHAA